MKKLTRRDLIQLAAIMIPFPTASVLLSSMAEAQEVTLSIRALGPYLDTLIPKDSTPGATELGVDKFIFRIMESNDEFGRLVAFGCQWLDRQAQQIKASEFALTDVENRNQIVLKAEQSTPDSLPNLFFQQTRFLAFQHYYAQTESWVGLNYDGPPQPSGFRDFASPPKSEVG